MRDGEARTLAVVAPSASPVRDARRLLTLAGALLVLAAYRSIGAAFYSGFALPQGTGMNSLVPAEIAAFALFIVFGGVAWVLLAVALAGPATIDPARRTLDAMARAPRAVAAATGALLSLACWAVARAYLQHAVISDDEHVYRFIAQTLAAGGLTAPSPGADLAFYREQFVVLTDRVRFGKYPIGYPALLALGQALRAETVVVPLIVGLTAAATAWVARHLTTAAGVVVAVLLFATSPQVLCTGATLLSQPAAALSLLAGVGALLEAQRGRASLAWTGLAGACFGYGILVRPLPGVLFAGGAVAWTAWPPRGERVRGRLRSLLALGAPLVLAAAAMVAVNRFQSGRALTSGYQAFHATGEGLGGLREMLGGDLAHLAMSVFASVFRLDVWLFGWPLSLLFLPLARRRGPSSLPWTMVGLEMSYRLIAPKAGIGGAGPIYLFEIVPLLCILSAEGAREAHRRLGERSAGLRTAVPAALLAGAVVSLSAFLPDRLADLSRMGEAQRAAPDLIARRGLSHAVVFHEGVVPPWTYRSWAYFPRCNSPALDDDVLYLRLQRERGLEENLEFWRRRYPDRSAWYFGWSPGGQPFLVPLDALSRTQDVTR